MRLTKVMLSGLKGQNATYELAPLTVFSGPNGSGKTAVLQAIAFAILGYEPKLGRSGDKIAPMLSGKDMTVRLEAVNDQGEAFVITRRLTRSNGATKTTLRVAPPPDSDTISAAQSRIDAVLGAFPVAFDLAEFMGMSHDRRRAFVFNLVAASGGTVALAEEVAKYLPELDAGVQAQAHELLDKALALIREEGVQGLHEAIGRLAEVFKVQESASLKALRTYEATVQGMTDDLKGVTVAGFSYALRDEMAGLEEQARAALVELEAWKAQADGRRKRRERLQEIAKAKGELAVSGAGVLQEMLESIRAHEAAIKVLEESIRTSEAREAEIRTAKDEIERTERILADEARKREKDYAVASVYVLELANVRKLCGVGDGCGLVLQVQGKESEVKELQARFVTAADALKRAHEESVQLTVERGAVHGGLTELRERVRQRREEIDDLRNALGLLQVQEASRTATLKALLDEEAALIGVAEEPIPDLVILTERVTALTEARRATGERLSAVIRRETMESGIARTRAEVERLMVEAEALKALRLAVGPRGLQGRIVLAAALTFAGTTNRLLERLPAGKHLSIVTTNDRDSEVFDLGWRRGEVFVPFETLSNGERLQFAAAIALAFVELRRPPLRLLLIDDLQNVDAENRGPFVDALRGLLHDGFLDNVIITSVVPFSADGVPGVMAYKIGERSAA